MTITIQRVRARRTPRWASAISAITPPSPLLSARRMKVAYLIETTVINEHVLAQWQHAMHFAEGFTKRIQRACADVAVDNADGEKAQRRQTLAAGTARFRSMAHVE